MRKFLIIYSCDGRVGSVYFSVEVWPMTIKDIRGLEDGIKEKFNLDGTVIITNFIELSNLDDQNDMINK